ncbi:MAG TPA: carboxypeptidase-like regulatory domain-containing protein [Candidatus Kapabacteria bacterium]|jgi:hypothetical protein|nr:carboxypeptidase-like regulatory domain-containing protein [Candidatus Kapabacteria bacterium]
MKAYLSLIVLFLIFGTIGCHSSTSPSSPFYQGTVFLVRTPPSWQGYDNSGTDVFVENTGFHTVTDSSGRFTIPSLDAGENTIVFSHSGWATKKFFHVLSGHPDLGPFSPTWLYPLQPQIGTTVDSVVFRDTTIFIYTRSGVVVDANGDTVNQGTLNVTSKLDTNIYVYGHSDSILASVALYLGLTAPNTLDTTTFFWVGEPPISYIGTRFSFELPYETRYYYFNNEPLRLIPRGTKIFVSAYGSPYSGGLYYQDFRWHPIYSLFTGSPANSATFIEP